VKRYALIPLLAALAGGSTLLTPPATGVEPVVSTPWDVRHDADELIEDLTNKRGDMPVLMERVQTLLAAHGEKLITKGDLCAPLAEILAAKLEALGLMGEFTQAFSAIAERKFRELAATNAPPGPLRRFAQAYPGTGAATAAWKRLANQAWDAGHIGQYLECARHAGESGDKLLAKRVAAAYQLLSPEGEPELPASLDSIEEMWTLDVPDNGAKTTALRTRRSPLAADRFVITTTGNELSAASDGRRFFVFDHLVGHIQGDVQPLGNVQLTLGQCKPAAGREGFVAIGLQNDVVMLRCLNRLGEHRWAVRSPPLGPMPAPSAPVMVDGLVAYAALAIGQDGAELKLFAYRADTGEPAWPTNPITVARIPAPRQMFASGETQGLVAPTLCVHAGYLLVLSNNGVLARVGVDGNVQRIWSYPSLTEELDDGMSTPRTLARAGAIVSDGTYAVATPADSQGLVLVLGADDPQPLFYQGDGANGQVMDVGAGAALLAGSQVTLLDLKTNTPRWSQAVDGERARGPQAAETRGGLQGRLGEKRALVASRETLTLFDLADGKRLSVRGSLEQPVTISVTPDLLMAALATKIVGFGKGASFLERLTAAAAAHPDDYQPLVRLASLHEARGDRAQAFAQYVAALRRGAPEEYAEKAARLVRQQLELNAGDAKAFPPVLAQLETLVPHEDRLKGELAFWRARHAELLGDAARAADEYRAALAQPTHLMQLRDRLVVDAHALAQAGLVRLHQGPVPAWLAPAAAPTVAPGTAGPVTAWLQTGHRTGVVVVGGGVAVGCDSGFLTGVRLADGKEAWWRKPSRPMLGVRYSPGDAAADQLGIPIGEVLEGCSAAGAGMQTGDVLTSFNGNKTTNFERDLRAVVAGMGVRAPFTATVLRDGKAVELKGLLGGERVEPLAVNATTVLAWPTIDTQTGQRGVPEGTWFDAIDLASGKRLFRYAVEAITDRDGPTRPLLTADDLIITKEAGDLVCLAAREVHVDPKAGADAMPAPRVVWRGSIGAGSFKHARLLGDSLLWLPQDEHGQVDLIEIATGHVLFSLNEDLAAAPVLSDGVCYAIGAKDAVACWDLGLGRARWRSERPATAIITAVGDAVYVLDDAHQLVTLDRFSGAVRRRFGDWPAIEAFDLQGSRLYLHVRRDDHSQSVACLTLPGGAVAWERRLPRGLELRHLRAGAEGACCVLGDANQELSAMLLGAPAGDVLQARVIAATEDAQALPGGALLIAGPAGMRQTAPGLAAAPAPLACPSTGDNADLAALAAAVQPKLTWTEVGKAGYALARVKGAVLVFARVPEDGEHLEVRLNDGDGPLELAGDLVSISGKGVQFGGTGAWHLAASAKLAGPEHVWLGVARLEPAPTRALLTPLLVRAQCGDVTDGGDGPWWLHQTWRPLAGAP
jgi:outer membrane protein assembly factor BamB